MKAHIGVDADSGLVHSITSTTAKVHDSQVIDALLHGDEESVLGDKAYSSKERRLGNNKSPIIWGMPFKKPLNGELTELEKGINRRLSTFRSIVEHPFHTLKCQFGYRKARYKGIEKNHKQLTLLFGLVNLYKARKLLST